MKKILSFFSVLAIGASSTSLALSSVKNRDIASVDTFTKEYERGISEELTDYFELNNLENEKVNDSKKNFDLNIYNYSSKMTKHKLIDNYEIVLNYFNYDSKLEEIYVDFEKMYSNNEDNNLIKLLKTEEFKYGVNEAFKNEIFIYQDGLVQYTPYLENVYYISSEDSLKNLASTNNFRSNGYKMTSYTKWYWFGTYKSTFNNALTLKVIELLKMGVSVAGLVSLLSFVMPLVGSVIKTIIRVIASYLKYLTIIFLDANKGRGVYFWHTFIVVWYVRSL
ncbi:hypothetical protein SCHIN_v1c04690 [Spiroplasma chinense]|uniref:Transmembrane protein n=1 Tax=Spiroplasma chinense TaxID=216932 RepID=A0A5B9Y4Q0_9MOLU|nr:hypothetical protein [Spiroplasma chinense]QEH61666.1 hypothetical protein SCHIN_v1c04690 [Spiroplasma chinense]